MKVVRSARLWFKAGGADKVYDVFLVDGQGSKSAARFLINIRYGRRGATMREITKTPTPVTREAAERLFESILVARANEGYRRADAPGAFAPEASAIQGGAEEALGRAEELIARLEACLRDRWPEDRERLFWRIGEVRPPDAVPALLRMAERAGAEEAGYSLVWALARCAGGEAAETLRHIAGAAKSAVTRGLADMASISALMGESRFPATPLTPLPPALAAAAAGEGDLAAALAEAAAREQALAGPLLVELYRQAQQNPALHAALVAVVARLPVRPPWLFGLRKLFKYAELLDDAAMFGAVAHGFETARPMYGRTVWRGKVYVSDLGRWTEPDHLAGSGEDGPGVVTTGLSEATHRYLKRRVWRALRKRGELGQAAFVDMATAYLLSFSDADRVEEQRRHVWKRDERSGRFSRRTHVHGPFSYAWTMGQLLYRHSPSVRLLDSALMTVNVAEVNRTQRGEAFPRLWDERPEQALRLAAVSCHSDIAAFGVRVLRANPKFLRGAPSSALETLLASAHAVSARLGFEEARDRLAKTGPDPRLLAALLNAGLAEARKLAVDRIDADASLPWSSPELGLAALTCAREDIMMAVERWAVERRPDAAGGEALARAAVEWLLALPGAPDERDLARARHLRRGLMLLWPTPTLPVSCESCERLLDHPSSQVVAAGVALLTLSAAGAGALSDASWQRLLTSPAPEVQATALALLNRLPDEQLSGRALIVLTLAMAPAPEVRRAARPLATRLAARFARFANDLFQRLIESLFRAEPAEGYAADAVALIREALPHHLRTMDAGLVWRLLQARAKGAQRLGAAALLVGRDPGRFPVRQLARLGNHSHAEVRRWVMAAYEAAPQRFASEGADAALLVESDWPDVQDFAMDYFARLPDEAWTPETLSVIADSVNPRVLTLARDVLRRTLRPAESGAWLTRLLEHPSPSMHLLVTELLMADGLRDEAAFARLMPFARIVMLQIHKGRTVKDRMAAFLRAEALASAERAAMIAPLFADLTLGAVERDRAQAILALRDIAEAHPGLVSPVVRCAVRVA